MQDKPSLDLNNAMQELLTVIQFCSLLDVYLQCIFKGDWITIHSGPTLKHPCSSKPSHGKLQWVIAGLPGRLSERHKFQISWRASSKNCISFRSLSSIVSWMLINAFKWRYKNRKIPPAASKFYLVKISAVHIKSCLKLRLNTKQLPCFMPRPSTSYVIC